MSLNRTTAASPSPYRVRDDAAFLFSNDALVKSEPRLLGFCHHDLVESGISQSWNLRRKSGYSHSVSHTDTPSAAIRRILSERKANQFSDRAWWVVLYQISHLLRLPKDWDGNDADPPTPLAVGLSIEIMGKLAKAGFEPGLICPTGDSGISFVCETTDATLTWNIDHDGDIALKVEHALNAPEHHIVDTDGVDHWISEFSRA